MSSLREPGTILDGKYEIVQRLGSGGMGEVYLVRHIHLRELRVIKILRQDLQTDPAAQKRFMREARLATQIKHPNVAILYDFAALPDEGSFYMVWEHIQGEDIGEWIRRNGPFPAPVAIRLGIQALRGLEAIHATGVIHRDLSPDNLMITEDKQGYQRIKIIDLGLARTLERDAGHEHEITQVGMFMGKLQYCSPEQASPSGSDGLDRRSDIYSFGLVLYEMITGLPPFESESQAGFIFKRLSEDPLPLTGRNPRVQVPDELDRVVRQALERDREKRIPDAISLIQALDKVEQSMSAAETREIQIPAAILQERAALQQGAAVPDASPPPPPARHRSTSELTKTERDDLLAQIDRAARRVQETSVDLSRVEAALASGRLDEARQLIAQIEAANPRALGLQRLKDRVAEETETERRRRIAETEQVLSNYIQRKQLPLARLALETLAELDPQSPKRAEHEAALGRLSLELEQEKRAAAALEAGREALGRNDVQAARRELEVVVRNDPSGKKAASLRADVEAAERQARTGAELDERRRRFDEMLKDHRVRDAEQELEALSQLDIPRVTLSFYRERLDEMKSLVAREERVSFLEMRFRKHLEEHDWFAAREDATEMGKTVPASPRAAEMFAHVERLESDYRKQQSLEQGVRQVEDFIQKGDAARAELSLKILLQMDPENRHRKRLEKQVKSMR
ncbi:MAG TPA: serine/threonine-protein kinase [Thermoanaerobaculia bacterium]|nr:serine/threonine-protein kinase [Thermoanaerobaculia bacterium]